MRSNIERQNTDMLLSVLYKESICLISIQKHKTFFKGGVFSHHKVKCQTNIFLKKKLGLLRKKNWTKTVLWKQLFHCCSLVAIPRWRRFCIEYFLLFTYFISFPSFFLSFSLGSKNFPKIFISLNSLTLFVKNSVTTTFHRRHYKQKQLDCFRVC